MADSNVTIIDAFDFTPSEEDYPIYIDKNNLQDATTFIDFCDINVD